MKQLMYALVNLPEEVHSVPGWSDGGRFASDRAHEYTKSCPCHPAVNWKSAAAPLPLYEHRNAEGQLHVDKAPVQ